MATSKQVARMSTGGRVVTAIHNAASNSVTATATTGTIGTSVRRHRSSRGRRSNNRLLYIVD